MHNQDIIYLILEKLFSGFSLSMLLVFLISLNKSESLKEFSKKFVHHAISIIRIIGIIYFVYYFTNTLISYSIEELFFSERATGPYAWAYWMMLLRPFVFCILVQLFWIKKIKNSKKIH